MDTPLEIARDRWYSEHPECCESCRFVKRAITCKYCNNKESCNYGMDIDEIGHCDDWVSRR